jgi:hypothetical protein
MQPLPILPLANLAGLPLLEKMCAVQFQAEKTLATNFEIAQQSAEATRIS